MGIVGGWEKCNEIEATRPRQKVPSHSTLLVRLRTLGKKSLWSGKSREMPFLWNWATLLSLYFGVSLYVMLERVVSLFFIIPSRMITTWHFGSVSFLSSRSISHMPDIVLGSGIAKIMKMPSLTSRSLLSKGVNRWPPDDYSKLWVLLSSVSQPWPWYSGQIFLCCEGPPWVVGNVQQLPWPSPSICQGHTPSVPSKTVSRHCPMFPGGEIMPGREPRRQKQSQRIVDAQRIESFPLRKSEKWCWSWVLEFIPSTNIPSTYCWVLAYAWR